MPKHNNEFSKLSDTTGVAQTETGKVATFHTGDGEKTSSLKDPAAVLKPHSLRQGKDGDVLAVKPSTVLDNLKTQENVLAVKPGIILNNLKTQLDNLKTQESEDNRKMLGDLEANKLKLSALDDRSHNIEKGKKQEEKKKLDKQAAHGTIQARGTVQQYLNEATVPFRSDSPADTSMNNPLVKRAATIRANILTDAIVERQNIRDDAIVERQNIRDDALVEGQNIRDDALVEGQNKRVDAVVEKQNDLADSKLDAQNIKEDATEEKQNTLEDNQKKDATKQKEEEDNTYKTPNPFNTTPRPY